MESAETKQTLPFFTSMAVLDKLTTCSPIIARNISAKTVAKKFRERFQLQKLLQLCSSGQ